MAISGTMTAADPIGVTRAVVGIDIAASGTFVASETWVTEIQVSGGEASSQTDYTLGDIGYTSTATPAEYQISLMVVYTEGDTDVFYNLYQEHINETNDRAVELQWNKEGGVAGDYRYTTTGCKLVNCSLPTYVASGNGKVMVQADFRAPWPIGIADIPV